MPTGEVHGLAPAARVVPRQRAGSVQVGPGLLGRVIDGNGVPLDSLGPIQSDERVRLLGQTINPLARHPIDTPLDVGVRSINSLLTVGRGQRIGLFAGSGVGKSVLLSMLAKAADCDAVVVGLIGERGREVREFIEETLGEEGLKRAVVVVATSDEPALKRRQAAYMTLAVAEYLRDQDLEVLCLMDSITRFAMAQREIGLAAGEPPTTKCYTPTVFTELPKLLERAGPGPIRPDGTTAGPITGLFTVLVDGDDHNEPIADAVRGILDGHIVMERAIGERGRYPAINILRSVSRTMPGCNTDNENALVSRARRLLSAYNDMAEMIRLGAYRRGSDPLVDEAIEYNPAIEEFLKQGKRERTDMEDGYAKLAEILNVSWP